MFWRSTVIAAQWCLKDGRSIHSSSRYLVDALRDEAIQARYARIVDFETGSISTRSQRTSNILRNIDRTRFWLVQVKASKFDASDMGGGEGAANDTIQPQEQQEGKGTSAMKRPPKRLNKEQERYREEVESQMPLEDLAILKLVDKKEAYNKQKQLKLEKKQGRLTSSNASSDSAAQKEVEMSWSSTSNDVQHKLNHTLTHLKKRGPGARVTVRIKSKKGKGRSGGMEEDQKMELVQKIEDYLCKWDDAGEESSSETLYHARKVGDVDWQKGKSLAMMRFEVVKGRSKNAKPVVQASTSSVQEGSSVERTG
ncbi:hypothetical protein CBS101457_006228 [Exobasidium rhododendri]|nr:hypothetical protein CBS101457_006228 [Exobasidium rhododendri]